MVEEGEIVPRIFCGSMNEIGIQLKGNGKKVLVLLEIEYGIKYCRKYRTNRGLDRESERKRDREGDR